jgi:hypothetical protein
LEELYGPKDQSAWAAAVNARGYNAVATRVFDHVLRSAESYGEKWNYVRANPVRAGWVSNADEWKYSGEIETLML